MKTKAGFTLIELMIVVAIIAIISAIAIPAYNGYIQEAQISTARTSLDSLKLFLEDYRLDNGCYSDDASSCSTGTLSGAAAIEAVYGWNPNQDDSGLTYSLTVSDASSYTITVNYSGGSITCDNAGSCNY